MSASSTPSIGLLGLLVWGVLLAFSFDERKTLSSTGAMHTARAVHTATLLPDGTVLVTGGFVQDRETDPFPTAERYDPNQGTFSATGSMTTGRQSHTATLLPDGRVLIAGGYNGTALSSAELYDPGTGVFTATGPLVQGRFSHRATLLMDGRVLMTGGLGAETPGAEMSLQANAEVYDPATGRFAPLGRMATARIGHTQTLLADGNVLIAGGSVGRGRSRGVSASAELFAPRTNTFQSIGAMGTERHKHAAVALPDGGVLIVGGSGNGDFRERYDTVERYDPVSQTFTEMTHMKEARFKLRTAVTTLSDGSIAVAGGGETVEVYDPATGGFTTAAGRFDAARYFSTATLLPDGRVLVIGGYDRKIRSTARAWLYRP